MTLPASGPLSLNDIQTEFGGTNPIGMNEYYAGGGLVPPGTTGTFGAVPSSGALSVQNFYGTSNYIPVYIEELFSTWLYDGNGGANTINNGIDLAGKGGLIWTKSRALTGNNWFVDTVRGINFGLYSNSTNAQFSDPGTFTSFNSTGYSMNNSYGDLNSGQAGRTYVSWTFREQPKFFDVVTYTGNGVAGRTVAHNLGSVPGCIMIKRTDAPLNWYVYHRSIPTQYLVLNQTAAAATFSVVTATSDTTFTLPADGSTNGNGSQYVAYLFAHNAGGFGLSGTDNVISCGSFTTNGIGQATVDLGYEPQWLMYKGSSAVTNWSIADNMRGFVVGAANAGSKYLNANSSSAELDTPPVGITNTGFNYDGAPSTTFIYIAIRRGPMKVPTTGTSVYNAIARAGTSAAATVTGVGFPPDLLMSKIRDSTVGTNWSDRLRGPTANLDSSSSDAEAISANRVTALGQDGFSLGTASEVNVSGFTYINWNFRRAPGFFDEVCYTGNSPSLSAIPHNLGVVPELYIVKSRSPSPTYGWYVYSAALGNTKSLVLNTTAAEATTSWTWGNTSPTASVFYVVADDTVGTPGRNYVAYLFATCPGVSKVGSFTGTGATQVINCGFTGGARFVLIKATSTTGDWYVWDSARGIVAGNDPYLRLNSTAAEVTTTDWVDTAATGFELSNAGGNLANSSGVTYIFLAIA